MFGNDSGDVGLDDEDVQIDDRGITVTLDCPDCSATEEFTFPEPLVTRMYSRGPGVKLMDQHLGPCLLAQTQMGYELRYICKNCKSHYERKGLTKKSPTCIAIDQAEILEWYGAMNARAGGRRR